MKPNVRSIFCINMVLSIQSGTERENGNTVILELSVAKSDMGKVIGKRGGHADAIRTILSAAAGKVRKRYLLEIVE